MKPNADIRLDILIKQEEDYYLAHCLQFDLVVTADTLEDVKIDIINVCNEHIRFSIENNNNCHAVNKTIINAKNWVNNNHLDLLFKIDNLRKSSSNSNLSSCFVFDR